MIQWLFCKLGWHKWIWSRKDKHPHCAHCGKIDYDKEENYPG